MATRKHGAFDSSPETSLPAAKQFSRANRRRLSAPGLRTFLTIAELWGLTDAERLLVLGMPARSTYYSWMKAVREYRDITLSVDTVTRISIVLGIHQALRILHQAELDGITWLKTPHRAPLFGGRPPMVLVTCGTLDGLMSVRRFLDAACGGLYMSPNKIDEAFRKYEDADIVTTCSLTRFPLPN